MGNIEIRDESSVKRRPPIFTSRNSFDRPHSDFRKSLTQRYNHSSPSPIRFSKHSEPQQLPFTQRKPNTNRQHYHNTNRQHDHNTNRQHDHNTNRQHYHYNFSYSPILNQETLSNSKSPSSRQHYFKPNKLKHIQIQELCDQQNLPSAKTGKIVSNTNKKLSSSTQNPQNFNFLQSQPNNQPFHSIINQNSSLHSPLQTKEIIRKVRNFNDFLNEIKRKLKSDKQQTLLRNKSRLDQFNKNHPSQQKLHSHPQNNTSPLKSALTQLNTTHKTIEKTKSMRKIQIALKLENQKLELQKYRKLVERELSKTHSIENISLCTKNSGQKILTIQYQSLLYQNPQNHSNASLNKQPSQKTLINKILEHDSSHIHKDQPNFDTYTHQATKNPNKDHTALLKKLKLQYNKMLQNVLELGKTIEKYEQDQSMVESHAVDDRILVQEVSDFRKKGSQFSRKQSQFSQIDVEGNRKASQASKNFVFAHKPQTEFRQKQAQSRAKQSKATEKQVQLRQSQSQATKKSTEHIVTQLNKNQSQCSEKGQSQCRSKDGSQKSVRKASECMQNIPHFDSQQIEQNIDETELQMQDCHYQKEPSRVSQAGSQRNRKQAQIKQEQKRRSQVSQREGQLRQIEGQMNQRGSQASQRESQVGQRTSQVSQRGSQVSQRTSKVSGESIKMSGESIKMGDSGQKGIELGKKLIISQSLIPANNEQEQDISFARESSQIQGTQRMNESEMSEERGLKEKESKEKIERISSLFDKLNDLQEQYQETDREVREVLHDDSSNNEESSFV